MNARTGDVDAGWHVVCRDLHVRRNGRDVLRGVSLTLSDAECVSLIGPNGAGKTTLMLALLGLLRPAAGFVRVDGCDIHRLPARARGRFATYLPQSVERLPAYRVFDLVAGGRYPHAAPLRPLSIEDIEAVERAIERCGLADLADRPVTQLSGGERQKALLAAAIAQQARLLLLDEPDTALDPAHHVELLRTLRALRDEGRAMVVISHDLHLPAALGGRVVALRDGRVVADGPAGDVLTSTGLATIYDARFIAAVTANGRRVVLPNLE